VPEEPGARLQALGVQPDGSAGVVAPSGAGLGEKDHGLPLRRNASHPVDALYLSRSGLWYPVRTPSMECLLERRKPRAGAGAWREGC
jgi:hypothetical protein